MKIAFLLPYPSNEVPSQRFRLEQYMSILQSKGESLLIQQLFHIDDYRLIHGDNSVLLKIGVLIKALILRWYYLPALLSSDFVFIHREAAPIGPPIFEWIIAKVLRKKIIYDFDDAIWLTDRTYESKIEKSIRWRSKVKAICKWSYKISCGNEYLADYARQFNSKVVVNPTTIDTKHLHNPALYSAYRNTNEITIGWTGSHSTLKYLLQLEPVLKKLMQKYTNVKLIVIANQKPILNIERLEFISWKKETEAEDLLKIDIGIMPLPDTAWTKGKCGFKALQYMAMGLPCVVSPVGVNQRIVDHATNGFLATTDEEWIEYLEKLIVDETIRKKIGEEARKKIIADYSVASNTSNFLSLFE